MENRLHWAVVVPFVWLMMLAGCSRREIWDDYPAVAVHVELDWSKADVAGSLPEGVRAIFYPHDPGGRKVDVFLPVEGGDVNLSPGSYSVVVYNYDTETVLVREEESYETIEAYTNLCRLGVEGTEKMVWGPDMLYTARTDDFQVRDDISCLLQLQPRAVVRTYPFSLKTIGLKNVSSAIGSVEGAMENYLLGKGCGWSHGSPIYFEVTKGAGVIKGSFSTFGITQPVLSTDGERVVMKLMLTKVDRSVQEVEIDITQAVATPEGGDAEGNAPVPEITLPEGSEIKVDDVEPVPGGGIGGDVGEWGDETEVELPLK